VRAVEIEIKILKRGLVEHLAAPVIKLCLHGHLCNVGIQYSKGISQSSSFMERPRHVIINDFLF